MGGPINPISRKSGSYETLLTEVSVLHRQLESKQEALLILQGLLDEASSQRDQFKFMAETLQERCQNMKKVISGMSNASDISVDAREGEVSMRSTIETLRQQLLEAKGDTEALRRRIASERMGEAQGVPRGLSSEVYDSVLQQLESENAKTKALEHDMRSILDEKQELILERDALRTKLMTLTNMLTSGSSEMAKDDPGCFTSLSRKLIDIEAMISENRFLHERLRHLEAEKHEWKEKKRLPLDRTSHMGHGGDAVRQTERRRLLAQHRFKGVEFLYGSPSLTVQTVDSLRLLCLSLLDVLGDKVTALSHLRKANRLLGNRISELERKLHTFEISGLWSTQRSTAPDAQLRLLSEACIAIQKSLAQEEHFDTCCANVSSTKEESPYDTALASLKTSPNHFQPVSSDCYFGGEDSDTSTCLTINNDRASLSSTPCISTSPTKDPCCNGTFLSVGADDEFTEENLERLTLESPGHPASSKPIIDPTV